jgi:two-component system KDP operon response regulator KdpE
VLRSALIVRGFDVRTASDPEEGLRIYCEWPPDLVITDLIMPGLTGVEVCRAIRSNSMTPVFVLSVRNHEVDKIKALEAGADDYITKPFSTPELIARIQAHLRRAPERSTPIISLGDFIVDTIAHAVILQGKKIHLTPKEFALLLHMARNAGRMVSHQALLTAVWGQESAHQPEYLRVFIGQLRKKLKTITGKEYIETEPWVGYKFNPEGMIRE